LIPLISPTKYPFLVFGPIGSAYLHRPLVKTRGAPLHRAAVSWAIHNRRLEKLPWNFAHAVMRLRREDLSDESTSILGLLPEHSSSQFLFASANSGRRLTALHVPRREEFAFGGKIHEECHLSSAPNRVERLRSFMWHLNEDCYEKRRRRSLFYTTVEAETLLQNNVRGWIMASNDCSFWLSLKGISCSLGSVMELQAGSSRSRECQVHSMLTLLLGISRIA